MLQPRGRRFLKKDKSHSEVLSTTQETMIRFLISLLAPEQLILSQEARSAFLKDPEAAKTHYPVLDQEEEEERDEDNTIVNGENNNDRQEDFQEEEDRDFIPLPPRSPRNSIESSKSVRI